MITETTITVEGQQESLFPPKPADVPAGNTLSKSVISALLFVAAFYFIFDSSLEYVLMLLLVVFIHEAGHFAAMKYFNYSDVKMFFVPLLGAFVSGEKREVSQWQRAIILVAGPFPGILLGVGCYAAGIHWEESRLLSLGNIFVFLNLFNLIPIKPLDGGNLVETLFLSGSDTLQKIFLALSGIALAVFAFYTESYMLLLLPLIFITSVYGESNNKKVKVALTGQGIDYQKTYEELTNREYWLMRDVVVSNIKVFSKIPAGVYTESANEQQLVDYIKSLAGVSYLHDMKAGGKILFVFLWMLFVALGIAGFSIALLANTNLFKTVF